MPKSKNEFLDLRNERINIILNNALRLFALEGFYKVTIDELAKKCKMSHGLFYHYFSSKDEVLSALINKHIKIWKEENDIFARSDSPKYILKDLTSFYLNKLKEEDGPYLLYLVLSYTLDQTLLSLKVKTIPKEKRRFSRLEGLIIKGQQMDMFYKEKPRNMVIAYYCALMGLSYTVIHRGFKSIKDIDELTLTRIINITEDNYA